MKDIFQASSGVLCLINRKKALTASLLPPESRRDIRHKAPSKWPACEDLCHRDVFTHLRTIVLGYKSPPLMCTKWKPQNLNILLRKYYQVTDLDYSSHRVTTWSSLKSTSTKGDSLTAHKTVTLQTSSPPRPSVLVWRGHGERCDKPSSTLTCFWSYWPKKDPSVLRVIHLNPPPWYQWQVLCASACKKTHSLHRTSSSNSHSLKLSRNVRFRSSNSSQSHQNSILEIFFNNLNKLSHLYSFRGSWIETRTPHKTLGNTVCLYRHSGGVLHVFIRFLVIHDPKQLRDHSSIPFANLFRILYLSVYLDKLKKIIPPSTNNVSKFPSWHY